MKQKPPRRFGVGALVAATFFMVAGGPYGLEELVEKVGFGMAIAVIVITPVLWSLPTALMVGELASAIPEEGGYYEWVRRALGPFWGFQEAWLSMAAGVFDMGIYPALFAAYLAKLVPRFEDSRWEFAARLLVPTSCLIWNLRGARAVGRGGVWLAWLLLAPFAIFVGLAWTHGGTASAPAITQSDVGGGILIAMWNTMGWDNASTIAGEVDRPQRSYPIAMMVTVLLVVATYTIPIAGAWIAHIDPASLSTGGWVTAGEVVGGSSLRVAMVLGGMLSAIGMLGSLFLSYSRIPTAVAEHSLLPASFAQKRDDGVPVRSVLLCGGLFALAFFSILNGSFCSTSSSMACRFFWNSSR